MSFEIDLHQMNFDDALRVFINKYNSFLKRGISQEILVIHGYGSKFLDSTPVIRTKLREYLSRNKAFLNYRLDINPGVTYVTPIKPLSLPQKKKKKKRKKGE